MSSTIPAPGTSVEHLKGFLLDLTATHGNSGGPVFMTATGRVFGVLQGGVVDQTEKLLQGLTRAEPVFPVATSETLHRIRDLEGLFGKD